MAFADDGALPTFLALFNSRPFDFLVNTRAGKVGGVQYEVGLVQSTPVPNLQASATTRLDGLARRGWSLKRTLDTTNEISHAFVLPGEARSKVGAIDVPAIERELADLQREIDELA